MTVSAQVLPLASTSAVYPPKFKPKPIVGAKEIRFFMNQTFNALWEVGEWNCLLTVIMISKCTYTHAHVSICLSCSLSKRPLSLPSLSKATPLPPSLCMCVCVCLFVCLCKWCVNVRSCCSCLHRRPWLMLSAVNGFKPEIRRGRDIGLVLEHLP